MYSLAMCKLGLSQERLKIEVKLLLNANRKSHMPRRLAQRRMTLGDLEWPFHLPRAISAVAELNGFCLIFRFCAITMSTLSPRKLAQHRYVY